MRPDEFDFLSALLKQKSGLALSNDKMYLLESRLLPIARARGLSDLSALVALMKSRPLPDLQTEVIEAMTTNESLFFRDGKPFEQLKATLLPDLRKRAESRKSIRIWSAACSTGQEPYSICMTLLDDAAAPKDWRYEIVATDLAQKVLDKAKNGIYSQFEAQRGLSIQLLVKHFNPQPDTSWQIKEHIRSMVTFRMQNLLEDFGALGRFDIILCRNVLIYFDDATKSAIIGRMAKILQPGGMLMLGSTEAILDRGSPLQPVPECRGVYQLAG